MASERKAFVQCAVYRVFAAPESDLPALDIAQAAVNQCEREKTELQAKLNNANAGKPGAPAFVSDYVSELHSSVVSQLAERLTQIRAMRRANQKTEPPLPKGSKRI